MKLKKVISVVPISNAMRGAQMTKHLTPKQRLSLLEDLRREAAKVCNYEYPQRIPRILEVVEQERR